MRRRPDCEECVNNVSGVCGLGWSIGDRTCGGLMWEPRARPRWVSCGLDEEQWEAGDQLDHLYRDDGRYL